MTTSHLNSGGLDLDLIRDGSSAFRLLDAADENDTSPSDITSNLGAFLDDVKTLDIDAITGERLVFELRRRVNPNRAAPTVGNASQEADNPFVTVDTMTLVLDQSRHKFAIDTMAPDQNAEVQDQLMKLRSRKRQQPFVRQSQFGGPGLTNPSGPNGIYANTLGQTNDNTPFQKWQPHFDRDFASLGELLMLPLQGPAAVTFGMGHAHETNRFFHAATRFLYPTKIDTPYDSDEPNDAYGADNVPGSAATPSDDLSPRLDNRWFRLFEFLQVPSQAHRNLEPQFNNPLNTIRDPGKINLNTIRHPEVLAALIDDRSVIQQEFGTDDVNGDGTFNSPEDTNGNGGLPQFLADQTGEPGRDWWIDFLTARDGFDPLNGGLSLPGTIGPGTGAFGSRPFRSFGDPLNGPTYIESPMTPDPTTALGQQRLNRVQGVESTLLRSLPADRVSPFLASTGTRRRLFEIGSSADFTSGVVPDGSTSPALVDPYARHRILSKMLNNTTNRSNVFVAFIKVGFFEATETTNGSGYYQIGEQLNPNDDDDKPFRSERAVFVIDRSVIEQAYDTTTQRFDWRKLVAYALRIQ